MNFSAGASEKSWQPTVTADSTSPSYWLNWRVLLCAIWVLSSTIIASILIWRSRRKTWGTLYSDETWRPCLKEIHPAWLLGYRVIAFFVLMALLVVFFVKDGGRAIYFYTQWTFLLVTIYFGLGSLLSVYGCRQYLNRVRGGKVVGTTLDVEAVEHVVHVASLNGDSANEHAKKKDSSFYEEDNIREIAGYWGYLFQIIYQISAGTVVLTDCVFWFIIVPFLAMKDYDMNAVLVSMHSVNAVFLLGDTALNCLKFPWFRISYFLLWTVTYVVFQWVIHACVSVWWPYPFLDLSSPHVPIWYLAVAVIHVPCYAVFPLIIKLKHLLLSRWFPDSYRSELGQFEVGRGHSCSPSSRMVPS